MDPSPNPLFPSPLFSPSPRCAAAAVHFWKWVARRPFSSFPKYLLVKANNVESHEQMRFQSLAYTNLSACLRKKQTKVLMPQIVQIMFFGMLLMFSAGSLIVSRGLFECASLIPFIGYLVLLIEPIQDVGKAYNELKQGEPAIERLFDLALFKSQLIEKPDAVELHSIAGEVKFCGLSFSYGDNVPLVMNDLGLHIRAGETVALIGPSGGGKTTLVKLLLRLYDPSSGSILIDGYGIKNIRLDSLRRHVGLVSQDTRNGEKLIAVGTTSSLVGTVATNAFISARKDVEHSAEDEIETVLVLSTSRVLI